MNKRNYEVISEYECCGKQMVTVKIGSNAHVMTYEDWNTLHKCMYYKSKHKNIGRNNKRNIMSA